MKISLPLRITNPLNNRQHWRKVWARSKEQRTLGYCATPVTIKPPIGVRLTRLGPKMMDDDNLSAAFKPLRDGIADKVGVNDGCDQIEFTYAQRKERWHAVEIEFVGMGLGKR